VLFLPLTSRASAPERAAGPRWRSARPPTGSRSWSWCPPPSLSPRSRYSGSGCAIDATA